MRLDDGNKWRLFAVVCACILIIILLLMSNDSYAQDNMCQFGNDYGWHGLCDDEGDWIAGYYVYLYGWEHVANAPEHAWLQNSLVDKPHHCCAPTSTRVPSMAMMPMMQGQGAD